MSQPVYIKHEIRNLIRISKIVTIHYFELDKNFKHEGESHDFWELVYEDKGEVIVTAEDKTFTLKQGEAVFHKPNEFHNLSANKRNAPNVFIITFDTNSHVMKFFENKVLIIPISLKELISNIIYESKQAFDLPHFDPYLSKLTPKKDAPPGSQQLIRLYLEQLLIQLVRENTPKRIFESKIVYDNHLVASIISYMKENIYNNITVSDICEHIHYKSTYLSKIFKEFSGYGMKEYYSLLKADEVKRLIREHNYTFAEISDLLHFTSPQYFSKRFKSISGMTPKEYMNSVKVD